MYMMIMTHTVWYHEVILYLNKTTHTTSFDKDLFVPS